ncbi:hypothetical protein ACHABX_02665 [Nesterenkonia halotolerans]|uniref:hypothetical protein n=1 Tax=Nesterenkonia halotolerans TaxID=225325 RepID=UPI003EE7A778
MPIKSNKLGPGSLTFGETGDIAEFGTQVTAMTLEPSTEAEDNIPVLSGDELEGDETVSYNLTGSLLQDYSSMESLLVWCKTHQGEVFPFEFVPSTEGNIKVVGQVKIRATSIGGDVKTRNTSDFEFKGIGDWDYEPITAEV